MKIRNEDLEELEQVKSVLLEIAKRVYRDLNFFYQAENKKQRRAIYNRKIKYESRGETYGVVCKTLCEIVQKECKKRFGICTELISCDNDEFGHVDIVLITRGKNKYIINCLSDLERMQVGMRSKRFASEEYFDQRYANLLKKEDYNFLDNDENEMIDRNIGNFYLMYTDDFFKLLHEEFDNLLKSLKQEEGFRKILLGESSTKEDAEKLTKTDLINIKVKFLMDFCNQRKDMFGHIELVRIVKMVFKKIFSEEERNIMKIYDCFFDLNPDIQKDSIFKSQNERIRFLKIVVGEDIYMITNVKNKYKHCTQEEYANFKKENKVFEKPLAGSQGEVFEAIRNKGIGVNILKHFIVKQRLSEMDIFFSMLNDKEKSEVMNSINSSGNNIKIKLNGKYINIQLGEDKIIIFDENGITEYYYENDELISKLNKTQKICYHWRDEGQYEKKIINLDSEGR